MTLHLRSKKEVIGELQDVQGLLEDHPDEAVKRLQVVIESLEVLMN